MKAIHKERLLKLAKHLRSGKLGHKKFDFSGWNQDKYGNELDHNGCGFSGCAVGECPIAFPKEWRFKDGDVQLRKGNVCVGYPKKNAMKFFGLTGDEADHLFIPSYQEIDSFGGMVLRNNATKKQVAQNIETFVAVQEAKDVLLKNNIGFESYATQPN